MSNVNVLAAESRVCALPLCLFPSSAGKQAVVPSEPDRFREYLLLAWAGIMEVEKSVSSACTQRLQHQPLLRIAPLATYCCFCHFFPHTLRPENHRTFSLDKTCQQPPSSSSTAHPYCTCLLLQLSVVPPFHGSAVSVLTDLTAGHSCGDAVEMSAQSETREEKGTSYPGLVYSTHVFTRDRPPFV